MTMSEAEYFSIRARLLQSQEHIESAEQKYMQFLLDATLSTANNIYEDFSQAMALSPFWINYPPRQRGRSPSGTSIPWGEVGEKTISANLIRAISLKDQSISFPGLPLGGDIRFATSDALIHFDVKLTGPNDNAHEIVASPHQVSGDGLSWNGGVVNSPVKVTGNKATMHFQPELPPFYADSRQVLLCLTYFLKVIYVVKDVGIQPLHYLELVCVPNGLLLFDGPHYAYTQGLFIPGKDIRSLAKKRTRVRLDPLARLAGWRCMKIQQVGNTWQSATRSQPAQ
jgi:hypothetical protein